MMINILVHTLSSYLGYRLFQAGMAVFALQKSFFLHLHIIIIFAMLVFL